MTTDYLLDTCVLSEQARRVPEPLVVRWLEEQDNAVLFTSAISLAEILRGIDRMSEGARKAGLMAWLPTIEAVFGRRIVPVDEAVARVWAPLVNRAERVGRTMTPMDSLIAATAAARGLTLVTRNTRDFEHAGIPLLNPWLG